MTHPERLFLYLPFEHSEDPQDQALAVTLIGQLGDDVLGRVSTEAELALLKDPMGSF